MAGSRGMLAAKDPLVVPMLLRLSHFRLSSYVVLVVSKQKGITLVFKTDPLQHVDINSTFDSIAVIQNFIQREIEGQLRQMFREDLPGIIHRLSQQWVKAKVEAPYLNKRPPPPNTRHTFDTMSSFVQTPNISDIGLRRSSMNSLPSRRPLSTSGSSSTRHSTRKSSSPTSHSEAPSSSSSSHPDLENFDPTYGLRPEGLPSKSGFKGFSNLFTPNKGLADLAEESSDFGEYDDENDERGSFDLVDWEDTIPGISPTPSVYTTNDRESSPEYVYETIPAVGGGTITRPRIYHSQSTIQSAPSSTISRHPSNGAISYFPDVPTAGPSKLNPGYNTTRTTSIRSSPLYHSDRPTSPDSTESQHSRSSSGPSRTLSTDLTDHQDVILGHGEEGEEERSIIYMRRPPSERRFSVTSSSSTSNLDSHTGSSPPPDRYFIDRQLRQHSLSQSSSHPHSLHQQDPTKIVLRLSLNSSIHQLSTLSHSNHTLSPYTRDVSHFTVRSVPPRGHGHGVGFTGGQGQGFERQPSVKAKRKRMYRLGKGGSPVVVNHLAAAALPGDSNCPSLQHNDSISPTLPAEFDVSDMDRYFRSYDDLLRSPNLTPTIAATDTIRRRTPLESSGQRV
jgi:distribution and morphology protein 34